MSVSILLVAAALLSEVADLPDMPDMRAIPAGEHRPLYMKAETEPTIVDGFLMDVVPVSNLNFYTFTQTHPQWQRDRVPTLFAERAYLSHWLEVGGAWQPTQTQNDQAVINVSWFSANAYCEAQGKRLPKVAEWEYVASASESSPNGSEESDYNQVILDWYARPKKAELIGQHAPNYWGIQDLHGLVWEWTEDFNSALTSGESRADSSVNTDLYCAAAASGATDPADYAAFLRYGFRSSLQAPFTIRNLGFRCATNAAPELLIKAVSHRGDQI